MQCWSATVVLCKPLSAKGQPIFKRPLLSFGEPEPIFWLVLDKAVFWHAKIAHHYSSHKGTTARIRTAHERPTVHLRTG